MSCSKSSLEAAAEAAARVNAMLIAKGKLKLPPNNNKIKNPAGLKTTGDLFTAEVEINDAPLSARNMLTRGVTQDEINKYSGAAVSTRGRYMTFEDRAKNSNERPLYLHVQASTKEAVELAIEKIHKIIEQHLKSTGSATKWSRTATTIRSGPTSGSPPPLMSVNASPYSIPTGQAYVQDKVFVGLEHASVAFQVKEKIVGPGESYLQHIRTETGANVTLRGKGSGFLEPASGREAFEPLHIHLTHPKQKGLQAAKELAINLIQTVQQEYAQWQQQQTLAVLTMQNQQSALGAQQVAIQQSLQQVGMVASGALGIGVAQDAVSAIGVNPNQLQTQALQVGGLNPGTVATSISAYLPTSLSSSLTTSVPSILTTNAGGQLQLVQGQVLSQPGGVPTLVGHTQPLQTAVTTANVSVLSQAPQVIYTPAFQQHAAPSSQAMVQATQAILTSQAQMAAATQQQQLSQVALQAHSPATVQQQAGAAPTTFYFVSQAPLTSTGLSIVNSPSAVQMQVEAQAQAQAHAQVQALAQVQQQQQQQQQQHHHHHHQQQQQQHQQQQQNQVQARALQQVSNAAQAGGSLVAGYPFQFPQVTSATSVTHAAPTAVSYPHYRAQNEIMAGQKRKFHEESQLRDSYLYGASPLRSSSQQGLMSLPASTTASYNQQQHHHHLMVSSVAAPGLQASTASGLALHQHLMSSSLATSKPNDMSFRDQQLMPPPPVPVSQGGNSNRNSELDRKRLKGALWNVAAVYGSSDEEDDDSATSMSPVSRQMQRPAARQRNFPPYGGKSNLYSSQRGGDDGLLSSHSPGLQGPVKYGQNNPLRYQYQSPFWMAPN